MRYCLLIIVSVFLFACGNSNEGKFVNYSKDNYSIEYPEDWGLDTSIVGGRVFRLNTPPDNPGDWSENINLWITKDQSNDLREWMFETEQLVKKEFQAEIHLSHIQKDKMGEYHEMIYSGIMHQKNYKWKARTWIRNNIAYELTYTAKPETFDQHLPIMDKVMETFTLKD